MSVFQDWLFTYALPIWNKYCAKENLDFRISLLFDSAHAHPVNLGDLYPNVIVAFLPPYNNLIDPADGS